MVSGLFELPHKIYPRNVLDLNANTYLIFQSFAICFFRGPSRGALYQNFLRHLVSTFYAIRLCPTNI